MGPSRAQPLRRAERSRPSSPSDSTPSSASPDAWPPRTIAPTCSGWSSTRRSGPSAPTPPRSGSCTTTRLEVAAWAGLPDELAGRLPVFRRDEGWVGEVLRTGHVLAYPDVRGDRLHGYGAVRRRVPGRRPPDRAAHPPRPGPRGAVRRHARAARLDERRRRVHHDPRHARGHRPHQRRAVRADRGAGRPARGPPGGVGPAEPGRHRGRGRPDGRRGDAPDHRLPQRPGLPGRAAGRGRPDRVRGHASAPTSRSTSSCCAARFGEGFTGWVAQHGEPLLIHDANRDPRGATIAGHGRRRRVDARRPDALRRDDDRGHHALEARPRRVRRRTTCGC